MKRALHILIALAIIVATVICFNGCEKTSPTSSAQPDQKGPVTNTLNSTMYFTTVKAEDQSVVTQFEAELSVTVTEDPKGSDSYDLFFDHKDGQWYDFEHPQNTYTLQHEELDLPYYCAKAYIYQPVLDGFAPYDFAVDFDREYMIYKQSANITSYYVVAASNPDIDPLEIMEHFSMFLHIYDYNNLFTESMSDFYFDMYGTWISEAGEALDSMDFYIAGTLPDEYADGDEVALQLNFVWPEGSGYRNDGSMTYTCTVDFFETHHNHPNFHGIGTLYHSETNEPVSFAYNIFPYDATVVIYINGQYLICGLQNTTQVESRFNYYRKYLFTTSATE